MTLIKSSTLNNTRLKIRDRNVHVNACMLEAVLYENNRDFIYKNVMKNFIFYETSKIFRIYKILRVYNKMFLKSQIKMFEKKNFSYVLASSTPSQFL